MEGLPTTHPEFVLATLAKEVGIAKLAPHDLRWTCDRLCHASRGELEQIRLLLRLSGHDTLGLTNSTKLNHYLVEIADS